MLETYFPKMVLKVKLQFTTMINYEIVWRKEMLNGR